MPDNNWLHSHIFNFCWFADQEAEGQSLSLNCECKGWCGHTTSIYGIQCTHATLEVTVQPLDDDSCFSPHIKHVRLTEEAV